MKQDIRLKIDEANKKALDIIVNGQPVWVDVKKASEFIPGFKENQVLHAGPPIDPVNASAPFKRAIGGAAVHEGLARDIDDAWKKVLAGEIILGSQLDNKGASGAAYAITASTPVQIVENSQTGTRGFCTFNEGPSPNTLRWGIYNNEVEERFKWFEGTLAPVLRSALQACKGINIKNILARAAAMGDENHSRQLASTALLLQQIIPPIMDLSISEKERNEVVKFLCAAERFFLHIFIAGAVSVMEGVKNIDYCTLLVSQGGNGFEFGTKFSFSGDTWYKAPAPVCKGMLLNPSWSFDVAGAYLGDSCVVETFGFGGASAAAGPMVVRLTGGDFNEAIRRSEEAREISIGEHEWAPIPTLDFRGPPVGIDMRKVVYTGITPTVHGGMHHRDGGQAGAGSMNVPIECFKMALKAFARKYEL